MELYLLSPSNLTSILPIAVPWDCISTMKQRIILIIGLSSLLVLPLALSLIHLQVRDDTPSNSSQPAFEPPDRGYPGTSFGSATR